MTELSVGMRVYVIDQFVSTDMCPPIDRMSGVAARLRGVADQAPVNPHIVLCHAACREPLIEAAAPQAVGLKAA
jgi:hypothetical protein